MKPFTFPPVDEKANYNAIDPIDGRYYDPEIAKYLSERSRIAYQAYVEAALVYALAEHGICSQDIASEIEAGCQQVTAEEVGEQEKVTKHDIKALVDTIKSKVSDDAKPYVHFGATSYDIVATALSLQLRSATTDLVIPRLIELEKILLQLTRQYAETVQIGRTHGQHAVPVTFGFTIAEYVSRLGESIIHLKELSGMLRGKFSGAVGAYNAINLFIDDPISFEKSVLGNLGIEPANFSTQIIPADNYVRLIDELVISAGIMANLSHDMRHLQRTEIAEIREHFEPTQTGSSTMAHKRNPWNFENVISMSKQVTAQLGNANANLSSEHQRDLTDSASARFYTIAFAGVASMATRLSSVMAKIEVDEKNMQRNLYISGGAIAAEPLYLLLEKYGHTEAHEVSKTLAHQALEENKSLFDVISNDQEITDYFSKFSEDEKGLLKDPEKYYTGLAAQKAIAVVDTWQERI
jgi:adenylosuccinate lyase